MVCGGLGSFSEFHVKDKPLVRLRLRFSGRMAVGECRQRRHVEDAPSPISPIGVGRFLAMAVNRTTGGFSGQTSGIWTTGWDPVPSLRHTYRLSAEMIEPDYFFVRPSRPVAIEAIESGVFASIWGGTMLAGSSCELKANRGGKPRCNSQSGQTSRNYGQRYEYIFGKKGGRRVLPTFQSCFGRWMTVGAR